MFQRQREIFVTCIAVLFLFTSQGCDQAQALDEKSAITQDVEHDDQSSYGLGTSVDPDVYAAWNISVFPDGSGLPAGSGTAATGQSLFKDTCVRCHGFCGANNNCPSVARVDKDRDFDSIGAVQNLLCYPTLSTALNPAWPQIDSVVVAPTCLPRSSSERVQSHDQVIGTYWPSSTTLFDYIRRAMPFWNPQSLSSDETYALTAYLLYVNGLVDYETTIDKNNLADISMPNHDAFIDCTVHACRPDTDNTACMDNCPPLVQ